MKHLSAFLATAVLAVCCTGRTENPASEVPQYFSLTDTSAIITGPLRSDTVTTIAGRIVCMSTTHVGYLREIGAQGTIVGVAGLRYVSDSTVRCSAADVPELDLEKIVSLHPDMLLVSGEGATDYDRLEDFGIRVLHIYDYMEEHPLARASYMRLMGTLTGRRSEADSIYNIVRSAYDSLRISAPHPKNVLINAPYRDAWYVPGKQSYMARLIGDAGGVVLGAQSGSNSAVITLEKAVSLYIEADVWINPGQFKSTGELMETAPILSTLQPIRVFNNNLHITEAGGNDFYESGAARPDLVLEDLRSIFDGNADQTGLHYYVELH